MGPRRAAPHSLSPDVRPDRSIGLIDARGPSRKGVGGASDALSAAGIGGRAPRPVVTGPAQTPSSSSAQFSEVIQSQKAAIVFTRLWARGSTR